MSCLLTEGDARATQRKIRTGIMSASAKPLVKSPRRAATDRVPVGQKNGRAKERILAAALNLFSDRGFDGVTTAEIAAASDLSQSVVLYHFGTKEALWQESMRLLFNRLDADAPSTEILSDLDPVSRLKVLLRSQVQSSARNPELGRVIMREGSSQSARLKWLSETLLASHYSSFIRHFNDACETGALKPCDPVLAMIMLHSAASMLFNLAPLAEPMLGRHPFSQEVVREQSDLLISVVFSGILQET